MTARFGPAGNAEEFYAAGNKTTVEAPRWLHAIGLNAYEYQCGRGVRTNPETLAAMKEQAATWDVTISLHAPYYISLASAEDQKRDNSSTYILDSAAAVAAMGGDRIVVHPGGLGGVSREEATAIACKTLRQAQAALDAAGLSQVHICPEVMGKINQLGTLDEVITMCEVDERFLPCVDFGHLNSRTGGEMNSYAAFLSVWEAITRRLGEERGRAFHIHFSKIEYSTGGEKRHLTFADDVYGPEPEPLMRLLAEKDLCPTVICESAGTQAYDALAMKRLYDACRTAPV